MFLITIRLELNLGVESVMLKIEDPKDEYSLFRLFHVGNPLNERGLLKRLH